MKRPHWAIFHLAGENQPSLGGVPPWIKALAEVRHLAAREGWCYQHVQAINVAIDQYAESALGNRDFFLNRPHSIGGNRVPSQTDIPGRS
jgi:hypothetical protein